MGLKEEFRGLEALSMQMSKHKSTLVCFGPLCEHVGWNVCAKPICLSGWLAACLAGWSVSLSLCLSLSVCPWHTLDHLVQTPLVQQQRLTRGVDRRSSTHRTQRSRLRQGKGGLIIHLDHSGPAVHVQCLLISCRSNKLCCWCVSGR